MNEKIKEYIERNIDLYPHDAYQEKEYNKDLKIIGVTGSAGKTTTIKIVNEYLKAIGKKTVLFASCGIDIPNSNYNPNSEVEVPLYNESSVLNALLSAINSDADYLLLEVNERTIHKGLVKDIPFNIRAITSLIPRHNTLEYTEEEYIEIKKDFFRNIENDSICIYNLDEKGLLDEFLSLNNNEKRIITSKYIANVKGIKMSCVDYLLHNETNDFDSLEGLKFNVKTRNNDYSINTKLIMPFNSLNIATSMSIIDSLDLFDIEAFNKVLNSITILGRDEVIQMKGRTVIVSITSTPHLEILHSYKEKEMINNLTLVTGMMGTGFSTWESIYKTDKYTSYVKESMQYIYNEINEYVDKLYITLNDPANSPKEELLSVQQKEVKLSHYEIVENRKEAIKKAILESSEGDVIFISGRGNRKVYCIDKENIEFFKDIEIAKSALEELKE